MPSKTEIALAIIVVAAAFSAAFLLSMPKQQGHLFALEENGAMFYSDTSPSEFIAGFKENTDFVVVLELDLDRENSGLGSSFVLLQSILEAKGKNVVAVVEDYRNGTLVDCQTNFGSKRDNNSIGAEECRKIVSGSNAVVAIKVPDSSIEEFGVFLEPKKIAISARTDLEAREMAFALLKSMYSDLETTISEINSYLENTSK